MPLLMSKNQSVFQRIREALLWAHLKILSAMAKLQGSPIYVDLGIYGFGVVVLGSRVTMFGKE